MPSRFPHVCNANLIADIHTTNDHRTAAQLVLALDGTTDSITWCTYFDHILPYLEEPSEDARQCIWTNLYQQWKQSSDSPGFVDMLHTKCVEYLQCEDNYHSTRRKLCRWYHGVRFLE